MNDQQIIHTIMIDIDHLDRDIRALMKEMHLRQPFLAAQELDSLVRWAHEVRGQLRAIEKRSELNIAEFSRPRGRLRTNNKTYAKALHQAREMFHDSVAVDRELAVCLTAIQHLRHEDDTMAFWSALPHLLSELKHVRTVLGRVLIDSRKEHAVS